MHMAAAAAAAGDDDNDDHHHHLYGFSASGTRSVRERWAETTLAIYITCMLLIIA